MEGLFPYDLNSLTSGGKYINKIATIKVPNFHPATAIIRHTLTPNPMGCGSAYVLDAGEWIYWSDNSRGREALV